jgi:heme oxygenase
MPALYRTAALHADLATLHGDDWPTLPLAPAMQRYVDQIDTRARLAPHLLSAHAYVRYMGDMSGGQMLRGIVARSLGLQADAGTAFYVFTTVGDLPATKTRFRAALDALPLDSAQAGDVTAEAVAGFGLHVELFEELDRQGLVSWPPARA